MAGVRFFAQTGEVATGTSAKTIAQLVAATNQRVLVNEISISFKGIANTDAPILVDVMIQTSAGTSSSLTLIKDNAGDDETLQTTALQTFSAEPSGSSIKMSEEVHPQTGYLWQAPFGRELVIPGNTRLGIRVTAGVSVSCVARFRGEE